MKHIFRIIFVALVVSSCMSPSSDNTQVAGNSKPVLEDIIVEFDETQGDASIDKNFYFLFDVSGSMDDYCAGTKKIDGAKSAISKFLEKVPDEINIGLLFFGVSTQQYGIQEMVPLGKNNRDEIQQAIQNAQPDGGTPLSNATITGTEKLIEKYKEQLGYGEYRLIIITDGLASDPNYFQKNLETTSRYPFIAIYGIGLCMEQRNVINRYALKYTDANNYEELGKALEETVAELEDFDPTEFNPDDLIIETE